jgi:hypothetical protein
MVSLIWDKIPPTHRDYIFHMNVEKGFREYGLRSSIECRNIKISHKVFCYPVAFSSPEEYVEIISQIYDNACKSALEKNGDPKDPECLWTEVMKQVKLWYDKPSKACSIPYEQGGRLFAIVIHSPEKDTIFPELPAVDPSGLVQHPEQEATQSNTESAPKLYQHPCLVTEPVEPDLYGAYIFFCHLPTGILQYSRLNSFMANISGEISNPVLIGRGFILADPEEFSHFVQDVGHQAVEEESERTNTVVHHDQVFPLVSDKFRKFLKETERRPDEKWVELYHVVVTNTQPNGILENIGD